MRPPGVSSRHLEDVSFVVLVARSGTSRIVPPDSRTVDLYGCDDGVVGELLAIEIVLDQHLGHIGPTAHGPRVLGCPAASGL